MKKMYSLVLFWLLVSVTSATFAMEEERDNDDNSTQSSQLLFPITQLSRQSSEDIPSYQPPREKVSGDDFNYEDEPDNDPRSPSVRRKFFSSPLTQPPSHNRRFSVGGVSTQESLVLFPDTPQLSQSSTGITSYQLPREESDDDFNYEDERGDRVSLSVRRYFTSDSPGIIEARDVLRRLIKEQDELAIAQLGLFLNIVYELNLTEQGFQFERFASQLDKEETVKGQMDCIAQKQAHFSSKNDDDEDEEFEDCDNGDDY